jgi:Immunoglobulin I-set domain
MNFGIVADHYYACLDQQVADPPQITTHTPTILQSMGKDVELLCQARGDPEPVVYWVGPNGKTISDSTKFRVSYEKSPLAYI